MPTEAPFPSRSPAGAIPGPPPLARTLADTMASVAPGPAAHGRSSEGPVLRTLGALAAVAALYFARDVLLLLALGAFLAFLLAPVAKLLEWIRLPRGLAATASVLALAAVVAGVLWVAAAQGIDLARRLPEYRRTIVAKIEELRSGPVASPILEATDRLKELQGELGPPPEGRPGSKAPAASARPATGALAVRVVDDVSSPLELLGALAGSVVRPLVAAGAAFLLAVFLLAYRADVRERLLRLGPLHRIGVTAQALEEAGRLVARYLFANLTVNVLYGAAVGLAMHLIGLPSAWLWGLLCALLRFVPYVGIWVGAALPLAVSIAVFDGWGRTGLVLAAILGCDLVVANLVEPVAYGRRTGLSPLAVVVAAIFWTWLWGPLGLLLAVPMTLCLAVVGRFVPGFALFHVLLGDRPVLGPADRAYDRLVALDAGGAARVAAEAAEAGDAAAAHDATLLAALRRAERDRRAGVLDEERYRGVCDGVRAVLEEVELPERASAGAERVRCVPAFSESDRVAAEVLARHLASRGVEAEVAPGPATGAEANGRAPLGDVGTVCVVALPPFAALRARHALRHARVSRSGARAVALVLDPEADRGRVRAVLGLAGAGATAFSLAEALGTLTESAATARDGAGREPAASPARGGAAREGVSP